ncbi:MAG: energy-coupling factor transporter ATPase [Lachnospiraceae bacterium]
MSLKLIEVNHVYDQGTAMEMPALKNINITIEDGEFIGLIGHTGSGKSTLVQHLNGLMRPTSGQIFYNDEDISEKSFDKKKLRSKVGLVFQYPEHQLFEVDILSDVSFGPKNLGANKEEAKAKAIKALELVGMDESFYHKSPFDLSGGQKRRVAIAGVLAMEPTVLVLDEPTAGLDPAGREEVLTLISELRQETGITIVLVSHSMDDVAEYADRILVMNGGEVAFEGTPRDVFQHYLELEDMGLAAPQVTYIMHAIKSKGYEVDTKIITISDACNNILEQIQHKRGDTNA